MGDINIYILLESSLLDDIDAANNLVPSSSTESSLSFNFQSTSCMLSADSTLSQLMDVILSKTTTTSNDTSSLLNKITVLDISYYPAKVITSTCRQFTQTTGPNSKTLQSLGWYPSGKLVILPYPTKTDSSSIDKSSNAEEELLKQFLEWQSRNVLKHEEFAYNNPNAANNISGIKSDNNNNQSTSAGTVQWTGVGASQQGSILKPSEIFNAVETRADAEIQLEQQQRQANTSNNNKPKKKKPTEKERAQRLDALLQSIDNNKDSKKKKKKAVSLKVRHMLLKQRSEGNKKLRMEDRFHLELVRLWDVSDVVDKDSSSSDGRTSYKFFSRQSTAGKVASSVASDLGKDISTELLVVYPPLSSVGNDTQTEKRYRRLPNTISLHDAQNSGYVNEFDVVAIRVYALNSGDGPSKSVLEEDSDSDNDDMGSDDKEDEVDIDTKPTSMEVDSKSSDAIAPQQSPKEQSQQELQQRIHAAFHSLEDNSSNPAKKKKKPVSKQVRSMLIKSKSTGNVRVKPEERLYLEVILFHDDHTGSSSSTSISKDAVSSSYRFFSKLNDMQHIITVCSTGSKHGKASDNTQVELIVERPDNAAEGCVYKALPKALTLGNAIQQGYIENFGRVLLRICNNDESYLPCDILQ